MAAGLWILPGQHTFSLLIKYTDVDINKSPCTQKLRNKWIYILTTGIATIEKIIPASGVTRGIKSDYPGDPGSKIMARHPASHLLQSHIGRYQAYRQICIHLYICKHLFDLDIVVFGIC